MAINKKDRELYEKYSQKLAETLKLPNNEKFIDDYFSKIMVGSEIENLNDNSFEDWLENRLKPNLVFLDEKDYLEMAIEALETTGNIAKTNFGSAQQRDEMALWINKITGYLGELAFKKKLINDFNLDCKLPHSAGTAKENMPSDIPLIKDANKEGFREPNLKISIKQTKWSGVWLDLGTQHEKSDIYVQVKVNTGANLFMSYLNHLGFFKDVFLKKGVDEKIITEDKKDIISATIKKFENHSLFAYVAGFTKIEDTTFKYEGEKKTGRKWKIYHIKKAEGLLTQKILDNIKSENDVDKINIIPIEKFSTYPRYIVSISKLNYKKEDWKKIINQL